MVAGEGAAQEFFFLEMNTRLQVEHPVTEEVTGLDLVEWQVRVAAGEPLPLAQEQVTRSGHAIEVRLYAEDPARGYLPGMGRIECFECDPAPGIRLESGVETGSEVSAFYDPMLAKVIAHAPTRSRAAQVLADALARTRLHGLRTNRDLLVNVLQHPAFLAGDTDTAFFDTHGLDRLAAPLAGERAVRLSLIAAAIAGAAHNRVTARVLAGLPGGWRNVVSADQVKTFLDADAGEHQVRYRFARTGLDLPDDPDVSLVSATPAGVVLTDAGVATAFDVARYGDEIYVDSPHGCVRFTVAPRFPEATSAERQGSLLAPMPGAVVRLGAGLGDTVTAGQPLVWLEAMKMEHIIASPAAGVLTELSVAVGQQVGVGAVLARVETQGGSDD
jgi:pyruvate carboxylase subunit A/propionyl-CoA carboxylase alpha chain